MHVPRILRGEVSLIAADVKEPSGQTTADEDRQHRLPAGYARSDQQDSAERDSPDAGLTYRSRYKAVDHVPERFGHRSAGSHLRERRSTRETVNERVTAIPAPGAFRADERLVTGHRTRVRKEQERTRDKRYVEDVITRTAEHFLREDNRESDGDSYLPQRRVDRHDQRNDESRYEEAFRHLFVLDLCYDELNTQTYSVRHDDIRQHSQQTEAEGFPPEGTGHACCQLTGSQQVLIADVEHTKQHRRNKRHDHEDHRTFAVAAVVDMRTVAFSGRLRRKQEGVKSVIERA